MPSFPHVVSGNPVFPFFLDYLCFLNINFSMWKIDLLNMAEGISSWAELENQIAALSSEQERGEAFEQFCHCFFLLDAVFQFETVYRNYEIPPSLRERLGYPGIQDIGIDGLAVTADGNLFAYQAKFRKNPDNTPLSGNYPHSLRCQIKLTGASP